MREAAVVAAEAVGSGAELEGSSGPPPSLLAASNVVEVAADIGQGTGGRRERRGRAGKPSHSRGQQPSTPLRTPPGRMAHHPHQPDAASHTHQQLSYHNQQPSDAAPTHHSVAPTAAALATTATQPPHSDRERGSERGRGAAARSGRGVESGGDGQQQPGQGQG